MVKSKDLLRFLTRLLALRRIDVKLKTTVRRHQVRIDSQNTGKIYVESLQSPFSLIALAIFLPELSRALNSKIVSYKFVMKRWYSPLTQGVISHLSIIRAIGARKNFSFYTGKNISPDTIIKFDQIKTKKDLLKYEYRGIRIGDLVYDTYLAENSQPTVELQDPALFSIFADCCAITDEWINLAENHAISAVCVSHTVYKNGIPARVCVSYGIPAFQVTLSSIYRLSLDRVLAHFDFLDYPIEFKKLSETERTHGIKTAKERMNRRLFLGESPELNYLPTSAHKPIRGDESRVLERNNNFKVLIATHDFYDSPHCNGDTLFEDFYVWLEAVAKISLKTNYNWYVKNHPFLRGNGAEVVNKLLTNFPNLKLIPPETSHQQIKNEGIDAVLTVYGTIGSEYAALGLKAVNACVTNPHAAYSFTMNPRSIEEFEDMIMSLDSAKHHINENEIYEYFYMHYLKYGSSWAFPEFEMQNLNNEAHDPEAVGIFFHYVSKANSEELSYLREKIRELALSTDYRLDARINRNELSSQKTIYK